MSYSRWSNSIWYTFWTTASPNNKRIDQLFEICDFPQLLFTYSQLTEDLDKCISEVKEFYSKEHPGKILSDFKRDEEGKLETVYKDTIYKAKNPTDEQLEELRKYFKRFIRDVQEDPDLE